MKKLLSLVLALAMLLSVGCFAETEEAPFELTVLLPDFYTTEEFMVEGNPVLEAIEKATGVRLKITWAANSEYGTTISTTLADANTMPMVMALTDARGSVVIDSARAGAFWELTDFVKDAENYPYLAAGSEGVLQQHLHRRQNLRRIPQPRVSPRRYLLPQGHRREDGH